MTDYELDYVDAHFETHRIRFQASTYEDATEIVKNTMINLRLKRAWLYELEIRHHFREEFKSND